MVIEQLEREKGKKLVSIGYHVVAQEYQHAFGR